MTGDLEHQLLLQVNENLEDMRVLKYNPQYFKNMLTELGARRAITELLNKPNASEGLTSLWELGRMDLSMEALIVENKKFHGLFPPEQIAKARKWLNDYGYKT